MKGNIPAGQIVQRLQSGEIIFRVGEGVQVGSVVNLRSTETRSHETVRVGQILKTVNGDAYCSTKEEAPLTFTAEYSPISRQQSKDRAHKRTICPLCNRGHNQIECPHCKDDYN